ncbi:IclR family transcriptional regulator [Bradyrhizobium mercantei]|uniref:IclR family transcriptional regulator n=1 Tax=Bradyrhizobium mercantei TaxID=1904807 RepID=UPI000976FECA|nr:IclR family transcriptional regulator [Bradyrhizobium mercantei]
MYATKEKDASGPLERYVQVLEMLAAFSGSLRLADIAALLELPKPTVHRLLKSLARCGMAKGGGNRPYELGDRLIKMFHTAADDGWLAAVASPHLRALTEQTGETCYLSRLVGTQVVVASSLSPDARWRGYAQPGYEMPVNAAASGKAIMAFQEEGLVERVLSRELPILTAKTRNDMEWIRKQYANIRREGYATCIEEIDEGHAALAVPVKLSDGSVLYAVAMTGPVERITNKEMTKRLTALQDAALSLASSLSIGERLKGTQIATGPHHSIGLDRVNRAPTAPT